MNTTLPLDFGSLWLFVLCGVVGFFLGLGILGGGFSVITDWVENRGLVKKSGDGPVHAVLVLSMLIGIGGGLWVGRSLADPMFPHEADLLAKPAAYGLYAYFYEDCIPLKVRAAMVVRLYESRTQNASYSARRLARGFVLSAEDDKLLHRAENLGGKVEGVVPVQGQPANASGTKSDADLLTVAKLLACEGAK